MPYQLLVEFSIIAILQKLPKAERYRLEQQFLRIQNYPANCSNRTHLNESGKLLHVCLFNNLAIYFWIDDADRHIKILRLLQK